MSRAHEMMFGRECPGFVEDDHFRSMCAHYCLNSKRCQFFTNQICDDLHPAVSADEIIGAPNSKSSG